MFMSRGQCNQTEHNDTKTEIMYIKYEYDFVPSIDNFDLKKKKNNKLHLSLNTLRHKKTYIKRLLNCKKTRKT